MKRIIALLTTTVLAVSLTACSSGSNSHVSDFFTREEKSSSSAAAADDNLFVEEGFTMEILDGWKETTATGQHAMYYPATNGDGFAENINGMVQDFGNMKMDIDTYLEISMSQYDELGIKILDTQDCTIDGNAGKKILAFGSFEGCDTDLYCLQICTIKGGKAYLFSFTAGEDDYEEVGPEAQKVFDTIKLTD